MRRRDFIAFVGGSALALIGPPRLRAASSGMSRIGVLMPFAEEDPYGSERNAVFLRALQERNWTVGQNVAIDLRWAAADAEQIRKHAAEIVALKPDVILAGGGLVVPELQKATSTVPIVFTWTIDPVRLGIVASLARPGGNATGFIEIELGFSVKWLELLKEVAPGVTRAGVLRPHGFRAQFGAIEAAAPALKMEAIPIDLNDAAQIERDIAAFAAEPNGGLIVTAATVATIHRQLIIDLAAQHRLPAIYPNRTNVVAGGLVSYGPVLLEQYRRAADYVDRILKGAKPVDLPVQSPIKYEMALNLKTAEALGLTVPRIVRQRATEIVR